MSSGSQLQIVPDLTIDWGQTFKARMANKRDPLKVSLERVNNDWALLPPPLNKYPTPSCLSFLMLCDPGLPSANVAMVVMAALPLKHGCALCAGSPAGVHEGTGKKSSPGLQKSTGEKRCKRWGGAYCRNNPPNSKKQGLHHGGHQQEGPMACQWCCRCAGGPLLMSVARYVDGRLIVVLQQRRCSC